MSFHLQSFDQRFKSMGDEAEGIFETVAPLGAIARFGWNRPPSMHGMSDFIRMAPDYYAGGKLVEVMGMGKDDVLKLKVEKYEGLKAWNVYQPIVLFVWSSYRQMWALLDWEGVKAAMRSGRTEGLQAFPEGKQFAPIRWTVLESNAAMVAHHVP